MEDNLKPKKIAILENNLISTYTMREALVLRLRDEGYQIYVITHTNKFVETVEKWGINVINVGSSNDNPLEIFKYIHGVYKALKKIQPTVCLTFTIRPAIWGNLVTRFLRIPTITNITGTGPLFTSDLFAYKVARTMYRFVLHKTRKVFFQNYDDMNLFIEHKFITPELGERIPGSGIDYMKFLPRHSNGQKAHPVVFLFIGRLIKDKGIFEFVNAAKVIKKEFPGVIFKVIGPLWTQNLKANIITQNELHNWINEEVIDYLGEKKDVRQYIADCTCVVLPSYREGTSNVLLEAASMEKPAITTNTTGCKEIVEDGKTGFLCRVQDYNDLVDKMRRMMAISEDERILMGKNARDKIIREYDKEIVIKAYLHAIGDLV